MADEMLTTAEVAAMCHVVPRTIRNWEKDWPKFPTAVRVGPRLRFRRDEVLAFMREYPHFLPTAARP